MTLLVGQPLDRVDGPLKVTGQARFTTDLQMPGVVHGVLVVSSIARGRIARFDFAQAQQVPGVLGFLTHHNALRLRPLSSDEAVWSLAGLGLILQDDRVYFDRQPVAVAIAETLDAAIRAAELVQVHYESESPRISLQAEWDQRFGPGSFLGEPVDFGWGDVETAWRSAEVRVEVTYTTPWEHHNPIELHNTIARWEGEALEVYDSTQFVGGVRMRLASHLGMDPSKIRVISRFVGGGFGSKGQTWPHVLLAVMASKLVGRPVHVTLSREQLFGAVGHRSFTHQHVRLGATAAGQLVAQDHESTSQTSTFADYVEPVGRSLTKLYACPNVSVRHRLVRMDTNAPTFMRAPGDSTGLFALESAMDELSYALEMDPIDFRLLNEAKTEQETGRSWSSRSLRQCYEQAAKRFGWQARNSKIGSMREGPLKIGWGMASATLHTARSRASVRVRLLIDGIAMVETATHEIGTGITTLITQIAAETLGLDPQRISCQLGDTALPFAPLSAGSQTTASVAPVVREAALAVRAKLLDLARCDPASPLFGRAPETIVLEGGRCFERDRPDRGEEIQALLRRHGREEISAQRQLDPLGEEETSQAMRAFGAHFVEVAVDPDLGTIRLRRYVGAFAVGNALNPKTARSQLSGAVVWGIGMALTEQAIRDEPRARVLNANLADYLLPVAADVPELDVILVEEADPTVNSMGAKGLGELGITGMAAAIANAVYHAAGKRIRDLPITPDKLL